jgi:hypothetical protein
MALKLPASVTCSGRFSTSQSKARGWGGCGGWVRCFALEVKLWERIGNADAVSLRKYSVKQQYGVPT